MIVLDTGGLYAFLDADDRHHPAARAVVDADPGPFVLSPFVLAEVDHLVQQRLGVRAECELLEAVDAGVYTLVSFGIGVTDASVAVVAARYRTVDLLSTDERHFCAVRPLRGGEAFRLLPSDRG